MQSTREVINIRVSNSYPNRKYKEVTVYEEVDCCDYFAGDDDC